MALYEEVQGLLGKPHIGVGYGTQRKIADLISSRTAAAKAENRPITGYKTLEYRKHRSSGKGSYNVPVFGQTEEERLAPIRAEQQRLAGIQQKQYETQQADIASQLKILQGERSAVSKAQQDYSNMLIKEAEAKKKAQEQAALDLKTQRANQAMAGMSGNLQIQPAGGAPRIGGTQQFRRRALQQGTAAPYKGLSTIQSGMVNP